jgi:hypothetical protein
VARSQYGKRNAHLFEVEKNLVTLCWLCHHTIKTKITVGRLLQRMAESYGYEYGPEYRRFMWEIS